MSNLIDRFRQKLGLTRHPAPACVNVPLNDASLERLMHMLNETRSDELTCEEVFNCLDEYVDCLEAYQDVGGKKPLVEHHLSMCPDCRDQLDALIHALENATATDTDN
ncbi:MAG: hypothetical protein KIS95_03365 [Anaerolineae bacterium]|uniref:hypothetical protein n=1 Tax=Promineifilum sp. TaxID=2664178 RepID=UPI001D8EA605|nr:hypothetical protein [Anaerolineales bacterium]MCB8935208.1 hypothetical protein [Promineifilum sp.]MCO5179007.1 hypothetical protein [Promineifilum sp.]MCW5846244.1 hypothetical protein [Anaerolineae bacterium]